MTGLQFRKIGFHQERKCIGSYVVESKLVKLDTCFGNSVQTYINHSTVILLPMVSVLWFNQFSIVKTSLAVSPFCCPANPRGSPAAPSRKATSGLTSGTLGKLKVKNALISKYLRRV